jgi:hypothetical protein
MDKKKVIEDINTSYVVLEEMDAFIQNNEIFPNELVEIGKIGIKKLKKHNVDDYDLRRIIDDTIEILKLQLEINEDNIKERDNLWKQHKRNSYPIGNHD